MSAPLAWRVCSPFPFVLALILVGCQTGPPATIVASTNPGPGASLIADPAASSQALIAADLEAGTIDEGTALQYRAWALFGDPRLPEKYDGSGSTGEDNALFDQIAAAPDSIPADQRSELQRYLLRPTDPNSPLSSPPEATASTGIRFAGLRVAAESEPGRCGAAEQWFCQDWSPDGSADLGFRVWAYGSSLATVRDSLSKVIAVGKRLWPGMTYPEPDGMGLPVPDTDAKANDGNGKVDVYLLDPRATCRMRGTDCQKIPGDALAAAPKDHPLNCTRPGFPAFGCSGYMLLGRERLDAPAFAADFAHEFFHILQLAHNGKADLTWYHEASAVWAEWFFERDTAKPDAYDRFNNYQGENRSLLWYDYDSSIQYQAWGWPLFQDREEGPSNVFETWSAIESVLRPPEVDSVIDRQLSFASEFRNFAVRNAQPAAYIHGSSTGLEADRWQTKEDLTDFPSTPHKVTSSRSQLSLGKGEHPALVDALAAQYDEYEVVDKQIRQIEIDISTLQRSENADLDVLAQIRSGSGDKWTRFVGRGGKVKLCRDIDAEDVDTVLAVVISNHAVARRGNLPDPTKRLEGSYSIESKNKCDERELHIGGRITWNATMPDELAGTRSVSGTADVVIHVTESRLIAELEDHSTYNYDFTGPPEQCPSSHEAGTLDTLGRQYGPAGPVDYSGGTLIVGGRLGQDLNLHISMFDYCGPPMGDQVGGNYFAFQGFPSCALNDQIVARFDGVESYVIDCDVIGWGGGSASASGHISGVLRPLDGPHPSPP